MSKKSVLFLLGNDVEAILQIIYNHRDVSGLLSKFLLIIV